MTYRWKIACINWGHADDYPRALAYALIGGAMVAERYFATWAEAVEFVNRKTLPRWHSHRVVADTEEASCLS